MLETLQGSQTPPDQVLDSKRRRHFKNPNCASLGKGCEMPESYIESSHFILLFIHMIKSSTVHIDVQTTPRTVTLRRRRPVHINMIRHATSVQSQHHLIRRLVLWERQLMMALEDLSAGIFNEIFSKYLLCR